MVPPNNIQILFNIKTMKIGCPLLQAALGGNKNICHSVDPEYWQIDPSPDLKLYNITEDQLKTLLGRLRA